jgi:hypothetical protein
MQSVTFAFVFAVVVTVFLMWQWKRVLYFFAAAFLVLAFFGLFILLSLM